MKKRFVLAAICVIVAFASAPAARGQSSATGGFTDLMFSFDGPGTFEPGPGISGDVFANSASDSDTADGTMPFNMFLADPGPPPALAQIDYTPSLNGTNVSGAAQASPGGPSYAEFLFLAILPFTTNGPATLNITGAYSLFAAGPNGTADAALGYSVFFGNAVPVASFNDFVCACFGGTDSASGPIADMISLSGAGDGVIFFGVEGLAVEFAAAVPEPSTYAMMLAGFAFVGFTAYRRRRSIV